MVGGNDVTHRVPVAESVRHLAAAVDELRARGAEVVVGTCPDLGALRPVPQPLRALGSRASRQLATAQRAAALEHGARVVSLAHVVGPFFITNPDEMFSLDRFHPSAHGYKRTAKAMLPSVLAALGVVQDAAVRAPRTRGGRLRLGFAGAHHCSTSRPGRQEGSPEGRPHAGPARRPSRAEPRAADPKAERRRRLLASNLTELAIEFRTDKWGVHKYTPHYERHLGAPAARVLHAARARHRRLQEAPQERCVDEDVALVLPAGHASSASTSRTRRG